MTERSSADKIATQHRLIGSLFDGLARALSARDGGRAERKIVGLRRVLDAHFLLEEEHYFPGVRDQRPERASDLDRLVEEHVSMRKRAEEILARLDQAEWQPATESFDALRSLFEDHEASERQLVGS
jgi:hemerythrin superfamily protein